MRILVTGGAGFVGSAVVRRLIGRSEHTVLNLDLLTYAAAPGALATVEANPRYTFVKADIRDAAALAGIFATFRPDAVMHLAAETHVDRSIDAPEIFVETNTLGTVRLLEAARAYLDGPGAATRDGFRLHHVSTDEVFGSLKPGDSPVSDASRYDPRSPYSASKAAADHLVRAWGHTYGLPVIVSASANTYGPYQFPEKLVPLMTVKALLGEALPVYGTGENVRDWLHVEDHADALVTIMERGETGETYFVAGGAERRNLEIVTTIAGLVDELAPPLASGSARADLITFVADRPGHDFRYALDGEKLRQALGWRPSRELDEGLRDTVRWYAENRAWWQPLRARYAGERLGAPPPTRDAR